MNIFKIGKTINLGKILKKKKKNYWILDVNTIYIIYNLYIYI